MYLLKKKTHIIEELWKRIRQIIKLPKDLATGKRCKTEVEMACLMIVKTGKDDIAGN